MYVPTIDNIWNTFIYVFGLNCSSVSIFIIQGWTHTAVTSVILCACFNSLGIFKQRSGARVQSPQREWERVMEQVGQAEPGRSATLPSLPLAPEGPACAFELKGENSCQNLLVWQIFQLLQQQLQWRCKGKFAEHMEYLLSLFSTWYPSSFLLVEMHPSP